MQGGFFFRPSDEDLSPGIPERKSHSAIEAVFGGGGN
jgi:hypothetical protein